MKKVLTMTKSPMQILPHCQINKPTADIRGIEKYSSGLSGQVKLGQNRYFSDELQVKGFLGASAPNKEEQILQRSIKGFFISPFLGRTFPMAPTIPQKQGCHFQHVGPRLPLARYKKLLKATLPEQDPGPYPMKDFRVIYFENLLLQIF